MNVPSDRSIVIASCKQAIIYKCATLVYPWAIAASQLQVRRLHHRPRCKQTVPVDGHRENTLRANAGNCMDFAANASPEFECFGELDLKIEPAGEERMFRA